MRCEQLLRTPIGLLRLVEEQGAILQIQPGVECADPSVRHSTPLLRETARQIEAYFAGRLRQFDLPIAPHGTPWQQTVWEAIRGIPYGTTATYGEVAALTGNPRGARSVGGAAHRNPILIVIPCHRIVGADGSLTGYAAGLAAKSRLLELERQAARQL